jgi:uncharacterized protein YjbI with pentapeptide repeats/beta-lactamase regulating signal transducer with metallopeptidase domain
MIALPQGLVTFASALAATALNALWEDALLVLCIWGLLRLWPGVNAATRYTVWCATLLAAFVLPVATTLPFFAAPRPTVSASSPGASVTQTRARAARHHAISIPAGSSARAVSTPPAAPVQAIPRERLRLTLPVPVAIAVFVAWVLLAAYALVRLAIGLTRLEQLKRDALPLPVEYRDSMPQWLRANKGARDVRLCVSEETDVPVAVGLFDAMILVPHTLLDRLSEGEVDQICLHELAHLRRADDWTNGVQRVLIALLGWNPAAQFIGQQLDLEREVACDDWVLSFVGMVRPYALCLTKMAERASWPRNPIPAPGVFATRKHISLRIERLLGAGRNMATNLALAPAAAAITAVAALAFVISVVAPSVAAPTIAAPMPAQVPTPAPAPTPEKIIIYKTMPVHVRAETMPVHLPAVTVPGMTVRVPNMAPLPAQTKRLAESMSKQIRANVNASIARQISANVATALGSAHVAINGQSCSGCDFAGVNWSGRDMHGVNYVGSDLSGANLSGTNFAGSSFNGVDFSKANLQGASFRNARLVGCDFSGADLSGVDFTGARISGAQFTRASLASTQLRDVLNSCTGCDFSHADLRGLNLSNVRANGDDFSGADLRGVNFAGAQLTGVDFGKARLDGANLAGATLNGCDLEGVDLTHVDLSRTKMIGMDFSAGKEP